MKKCLPAIPAKSINKNWSTQSMNDSHQSTSQQLRICLSLRKTLKARAACILIIRPW